MRRIALLLALGAAALVVASPFAESRPSGSLKVVERISAERALAPLTAASVTANCPSGYVAIAGMEFMGAIDLIASFSNQSRRGWTVTGGNPSTSERYGFRAAVVCAKGGGSVRVRKAAAGEVREAIRQYKQKLREER